MDIENPEQALSALAQEGGELYLPTGRLRRSRLTRDQITQAFHDSFELIGGVPRLAIWADANPTEFYKLYARLLPSGSFEGLNSDNQVIVMHVLPRSALDREKVIDAQDSHDPIRPTASVHALPSAPTALGNHGLSPPSGEDSGGRE